MEKSELRIILPEEMPDTGIPPFGGRYHYEDEYREYLEKSQPLFDEFERTGKIAEVEALKGRPMVGLTSEEEWLLCFEHVMMRADCVTVEEQDGRYIISSNGRHRMYVAKKYGLKLLVRFRWWEE
ncbi:MAG: hypothetical protein K6B68_13610 [Eubacterium sp.]|nr:hypothetical protein [Eubacterium sp.]